MGSLAVEVVGSEAEEELDGDSGFLQGLNFPSGGSKIMQCMSFHLRYGTVATACGSHHVLLREEQLTLSPLRT